MSSDTDTKLAEVMALARALVSTSLAANDATTNTSLDAVVTAENALESAIRSLAASPQERPGWQWVPIEATAEMCFAIGDSWGAVLAAAPKEPT